MNLNPIPAILNAGGGIIKSLFGDKAKREDNEYSLNAQSLENWASENYARANRTWFDSLIDGINRLPRPIIIFFMLYYIQLSWRDVEQFKKINAGLATVPVEMWEILIALIVAQFGVRELFHFRKAKGSRESIKAVTAKVAPLMAGDDVASREKFDSLHPNGFLDD